MVNKSWRYWKQVLQCSAVQSYSCISLVLQNAIFLLLVNQPGFRFRSVGARNGDWSVLGWSRVVQDCGVDEFEV